MKTTLIVSFAACLLLASSAEAASKKCICNKVGDLYTGSNMVGFKCETADQDDPDISGTQACSSGGGAAVVYFESQNQTDQNFLARFLSLLQNAHLTGRKFEVWYDDATPNTTGNVRQITFPFAKNY